MLDTLANPPLHRRASEGYKKAGQSIDLYGSEDALICREAAVFWHEETSDGYTSMRARIDSELAAVRDEIGTGGIMELPRCRTLDDSIPRTQGG